MGTTPSEEVELTHHEKTKIDSFPKSEDKLAYLFEERTGIYVPPKALRMILRSRIFPIISKLAHEIHDGNP